MYQGLCDGLVATDRSIAYLSFVLEANSYSLCSRQIIKCAQSKNCVKRCFIGKQACDSTRIGATKTKSPGIFVIGVYQVPVVLRQQVDVVKYEALVVVVFQGLCGADVHQHCAVERAGTILLNWKKK